MSFLAERSNYIGNPIEEDTRAAKKLEDKGKNIIKLNRGDPPLYFPTPQYIIDAYVEALKAGKTNYGTMQGLPELREAISKRYMRLYDANISESSIVVTHGVSEALLMLNQIMIDHHDRAVLFRPYFTEYLPYLKFAHGEHIDERYDEANNWSIDTDKLERSCKKDLSRKRRLKYMLITNPNNPTGTVLDRNVLEEVVDIANDYGLVLISDEIYDEIIFNGAKFTSVTELAKGVPHIILHGASKVYQATGFRLGFVLIPEDDKKSNEIKGKLIDYTNMRLSANHPAQWAVAEGMNNYSEHEKVIDYITREVEDRSNYACDLLNENEHLHAVRPRGAFYIFVRINKGSLNVKTDREFVKGVLQEEYVQLTRGSAFGEPNYFRIVSLPPKEILGQAIKKINKFCDRHAV